MQKIDIVVFSLPAWKGNYIKSTVELTKELVHNENVNNVLFVDYQRTIKDLIFDKTASILSIFGVKNRLVNDNGVQVYTPLPILPTNWIDNPTLYRVTSKFNAWLLKIGIKRQLKKLNFRNTVVINAYNPVFGYFLNKKLGEKLTVYYCFDEISASKWVRKHGVEYEKLFMAKSDLVICSSVALAESKSKYNSNTVVVKNGAPYELYYKNFKPSKYEHVSKPIIGYTGSIDDRVNYNLLEYCIKCLPEYTFKLIGRISDYRAYELKKYDNVILTGGLTHEPYSAELNTLHVAIIPFIQNEFTRNCNVLKINDYFSAGIPVVSTTFGDITDFKDHISITDDNHEFVLAIKKELENITPKKSIEKTLIGKKNSWVNRSNDFVNEILKCF